MVAEHDRERERAVQPRQHRLDRIRGRCAALDLALDQMRDDFGIGLALNIAALGDQLLAQRLEILDDAVVDQRDSPTMCGWALSSVGAPCVAQRVWAMPVAPGSGSSASRRARLSSLPSARRRSIAPSCDRRDARRIIAAIFEPPQPVDQPVATSALPTIPMIPHMVRCFPPRQCGNLVSMNFCVNSIGLGSTPFAAM